MKDVSRRGFIKGAGLSALSLAAVGVVTGCTSGEEAAPAGEEAAPAGEEAAPAGEEAAPAGEEASAPQASWMPDSWDYETDILVVGYGGAGLWAALTAKDEGKSEVLVLEKAPSRGGGNTSINFGQFTWTSDVDKAVEYMKAFSKGMMDEDICRAWAEESYYNMDYCDRWGLTDAADLGPASEYPFLPGAEAMNVAAMGANGCEGWTILDKARADQGIEVIFSCHDEELIQNPETKEILGCYTLIGDDGTPKAVKARKGVIMTTGGFEFNEDMKNEYLKCYPMRGFFGWPFNTGDGHKMVEKVGARLRNMSNIAGGFAAVIEDWPWKTAFMLYPPAPNYIMVDRLGNRWVNEMLNQGGSPHWGWHNFLKFNDTELCDFERIPSWVIMDQKVIDAGPLGCVEGGILTVAGGLATGMGLSDIPEECGKVPGWSLDNQVEIEKGWIKKADTIEELVELMSAEAPCASAEAIKASIEKYNEGCDAGIVDEFGRELAPEFKLGDGPYYAYPNYPGGVCTLGGPDKNVNAQVLDINDQVIPRLYAAGSFGNMAAHSYGLTGGNNAENMIWGRIAARHAASLEPWDAEAQA